MPLSKPKTTNDLLRFIKRYYFPLLFIASLAALIIVSRDALHKDYKRSITHFQEQFDKSKLNLTKYIDQIAQLKDLDSISFIKKQDYATYLYKNDSLCYWNNNKIPISSFEDQYFPKEGISHLQNGWYYTQTYTRDSITIAVSFLIRHQYAYENQYLKNNFNPKFEFPYKGYISLEQHNSYPIYDNGKFIFGVVPYAIQNIKYYYSDGIFGLLILSTFFLLFSILQYLKNKSNYTKLIMCSLIVWLRYLSLTNNWFSVFDDITAFQSTLYASSSLFPSFADFWLNIIVIIFAFKVLIGILLPFREDKKINFYLLRGFLSTIFVLFLIILSGYLFKGLIENSSIKLDVSKLFNLNFYSFFALASFGLIFYEAIMGLRRIINFYFENEVKPWIKWFGTELLAAGYIVFNLFSGFPFKSWGLMVLLFFVFHWFCIKYKKELPNYTIIIILFLFSLHSFNILQNLLDKKERQERILLANQLASDQDITTELEYDNIKHKIQDDSYLIKLLKDNKRISPSVLQDNLEKEYFNNFWEQYEVDFFLFNEKKHSLLNYSNERLSGLRKLDDIITFNSIPSDIDPNIYYIRNFTSQYAYIIKQFIQDDHHFYGYLYIALKTKKIPEKIGYPRLLISSKSKVFNVLENYSIAKYYNHKLVYDYGKFVFPSIDNKIVERLGNANEGFVNRRGFNHYIYKQTDMDMIIVSKPVGTTFQFFTSFSYLFCFFGLLLLLPFFERLFFKKKWKILPTLALRIQILLVGIVLITLFAYGIGSWIFIQRQYSEITSEHIRDKLNSISINLKILKESDSSLFHQEEKGILESQLINLANVFTTDINIFEPNGYLLSTSRQKLFNSGLISEQINSDALKHITRFNNSEYIHAESIGGLSYTSGYAPIYNSDGTIGAIINLQQFGQQEQYQLQIEHYLVSILNIFILLLAFTTMFTLFISNWITLPLKKLRDSVSNIRLGKYNQPIEYQGKDEIGELVDRYNEKLQELEYTAQQLAQSERENAWKEMAKQVAHEIKNPLTPMKLRLQHFKRLFDEQRATDKDQVDSLVNSMIEQIDTLAGIANEFSNFAKMPKSEFSVVDLVSIIKNVKELYQSTIETEIEFFHAKRECNTLGSRDLLLRVFNNLIQNALQSIPENRNPKIGVFIHKIQDEWRIEIKDNGSGIPKELQPRIFTPYFTTKSKGTGLGLAMVKQIIDLHGGKISYDTSESGTTFHITFKVIESADKR